MLNGKRIIALCTYRIYEAQEFDFLSELGTYSTVYEESMDINKLIAIADERMYTMKRKTKEGL